MAEVLDDGLLHFQVKGREGEQTIDVLLLKLACQEVVDKHQLAVSADNRYVPTAAFLKDLSDALGSLGLQGCTASIAFQLWRDADAAIEQQKKSADETQTSPIGSGSIPEG
jgi:hypothetical protein